MTATEHEYALDVSLAASLRVKGPTLEAALAKLRATVDCVTANLGAWEDGSPILAEVSVADQPAPHCYEINGENVELELIS